MREDLRQAIRALTRSPLYAIVGILTLALGIGATTAAFTVVGSVLLKPLPFAEPQQLVSVFAANRNSVGGTVMSYPAFQDVHAKQDVFSGFAYVTGDGTQLRRPSGSEPVLAAMVSDDFFPLLRAKPTIGRLITPDDNKPGAPPVAVLDHRTWVEDFAADPRVLGTSVDLVFGHFTVVGVLNSGEAYPDWIPGVRANFYVPLRAAPYMADKLRPRTNHTDARAIARLKPGVTPDQAEREIRTLTASLAAAYPATDSAFPSALVRPLRDQVVGDISPALAVLAVAVVLVLLLACADVANLALVRATSREREIAVRAALGAGRLRIARVLLAESGAMAVGGAVFGVALAFVGVRVFVAAAPVDIPRLDEIGVDWRALTAAIAAATIATALCALVPLAALGRGTLVPALKTGGKGSGVARRGVRLRGAIVSVQVALSVTLIVGAGLLIKSFALLRDVNPGFDTKHVLGFHLVTPKGQYEVGASTLALMRRVSSAISGPGVTSVAYIRHRPLAPAYATTQLGPDGRDPASDSTGAIYQIVSPRLFATIGIPIIQGREFTDADIDAASIPSIVTEYTAKKLWPKGDPIGHELNVINGSHGDSAFGKTMRTTVVGVVGNVKKTSLDEPSYPVVYVPLGQPGYGAGDVVVRTTGAPETLVGAMRHAVASVDPDIAIRDLGTAQQWMATSVAREQFIMTLLTIFSGIALILAALGLYGVIAYSVTQRTPELGIRMALGARVGDVVALVAQSAMTLVAIGLALGAGGALALGRMMRSLLYGIGPNDPATLITVAGILAVVAVIASYLPARRAARVDPVVALRSE